MEACLEKGKVLLELEWNSEEQTMELRSVGSQQQHLADRFKGELYLDLNSLALGYEMQGLCFLAFLSHQPHHLIKASPDEQGLLGTNDKFYIRYSPVL